MMCGFRRFDGKGDTVCDLEIFFLVPSGSSHLLRITGQLTISYASKLGYNWTLDSK